MFGAGNAGELLQAGGLAYAKAAISKSLSHQLRARPPDRFDQFKPTLGGRARRESAKPRQGFKQCTNYTTNVCMTPVLNGSLAIARAGRDKLFFGTTDGRPKNFSNARLRTTQGFKGALSQT